MQLEKYIFIVTFKYVAVVEVKADSSSDVISIYAYRSSGAHWNHRWLLSSFSSVNISSSVPFLQRQGAYSHSYPLAVVAIVLAYSMDDIESIWP